MMTNRSMPQSTVIPEIGYADVTAAVDWLCTAFGFAVRIRIADHRAQLNVGDGAIVIRGVERGEASGNRDRVMVRVENVDAHCENAERNGAKIVNRPTNWPFGERQYTAEDFSGRQWVFSQTIRDVAPEDWGGLRR